MLVSRVQYWVDSVFSFHIFRCHLRILIVWSDIGECLRNNGAFMNMSVVFVSNSEMWKFKRFLLLLWERGKWALETRLTSCGIPGFGCAIQCFCNVPSPWCWCFCHKENDCPFNFQRDFKVRVTNSNHSIVNGWIVRKSVSKALNCHGLHQCYGCA